MKTGANFLDRNRIRDLYGMGLSPREISEKLQISLMTVESFKPKSTRKKTEKVAEDDQ